MKLRDFINETNIPNSEKTRPCPNCGGKGWIEYVQMGHNSIDDCKRCKGKGRIPKNNKQKVNEMTMPLVNDVSAATAYINKAYQASMGQNPNQDVMGGLQASMQWLQQQPGLGKDSNLMMLAKKAKAAKAKLDTVRKPLATQQAQFTNVKPTNSFGTQV